MTDYADVMATADLPPGQMKAVEIDGVEVAVANVGGTCFAFANLCPHDAGPLADGELDGATVICPWHQTRFDLRSGAALEGLTSEPVPTFPVKVEGGRILVGRL